LAHANSLIEIAFEHSLENRVIGIAWQGNKIHPYPIDHKRYLCIVPSGSNHITLTTKAEEVEHQYALDVESGTKTNTRYVFAVTYLLPTPNYSEMVIHSPVISPWSITIGDNAIYEGDTATPGAKEFIHIEGYTGTITLVVSDTRVRLYPYPNPQEEGESTYYIPSAILKNQTIDSLMLEGLTKNILIGRNTNDINPINLKVDSNGKLLLRKAKDGHIPINTVDEMLLVNTDLKSNYKQEADIDLSCISTRNWEPIGNFESPFKGTYDGNGYAIHSLNMDIKEITSLNPDYEEKTDIQYKWILPAGAVGLFGVNQGTITNVHIASGKISVSEVIRKKMGHIAVGAICGYNDGGYITSCINKAELKLHTLLGDGLGLLDDVFTAGGICGTSRGSVEYSINDGDIITENMTVEVYIGGICGILYSRYTTDEIKINSCINHGNLLIYFNDITPLPPSSVLTRFFGGISGMMFYLHSNSEDTFKETIQQISNCYNTGNIIEVAVSPQDGAVECSGIVPFMRFPGSTYSCKISSCYTIGEIKILPGTALTMLLDPIIWVIREFLDDFVLSFKLPVENCFYNAATWTGNRYNNYSPYAYVTNSNDVEEELKNMQTAKEQILEATPAFSRDSWPTPDLWDTNVWGDLGSWNNGNPIYPKLRFEKD
jgi:hypothetical protein